MFLICVLFNDFLVQHKFYFLLKKIHIKDQLSVSNSTKGLTSQLHRRRKNFLIFSYAKPEYSCSNSFNEGVRENNDNKRL